MYDRLDQRARERIGGPAWDAIRSVISTVHSALVSPSGTSLGELTTIYVKYLDPAVGASPYAVMWIKKSSSLVVGLALPTTATSPLFVSAPAGCKYAGLTKYLCFSAGDAVPSQLPSWAFEAYQNCYGSSDATV